MLVNSGGSDTGDRVVRINGYDNRGGYYYAGTGYLLGGNLVLTAGHVIEGEQLTARLGNGSRYQARVLDKGHEVDIGLLELSTIRGQFNDIKIGDVKEGGDTHIKTLNPKDFYYDGGSGSWIDVEQKRHITKTKEIKAAEEAKKKVEAELEELRREEDDLFRPYYSEKERAMLTESGVPETGSGRNESMYYYYGRPDGSLGPVWQPGMSGSGVFNARGELVGVVNGYHGEGVAIGGGYYIPNNAPPLVIEKFDSILNKRAILHGKLDAIAKVMYVSGGAYEDKAVSPSAILDFLKGYCGSTASTRAN